VLPTRKLIEELGLDRDILVKSLIPTPFAIHAILDWDKGVGDFILTIVSAVLIGWFSYVFMHIACNS